MMRQVVMVNWRYIGDALPAFVTVMFIPFGYSAAYGLIAGLMTYTALNGLVWLTKLLSRGYIVPDDEDHREYWTSKLPQPHTARCQANVISLVIPHGKLPWFITAGQAVAARFGHGSSNQKQDSESLKSGESQERFRSQSKASSRELDAVVVAAPPRDQRDEKVLRSKF